MPQQPKKLLDQVRDAIRRKLMGHKAVKTTMVYTHVMNKGPLGVRSPLDS